MAPHIQVCISYERGLTSWIRGGAFAEVHTEIGVPRALGAMLDTAARAQNEAEINVIFEQWASTKRQAEDACRLRRIEELREAARRRARAGECIPCNRRENIQSIPGSVKRPPQSR